jgi:hypothetical protein
MWRESNRSGAAFRLCVLRLVPVKARLQFSVARALSSICRVNATWILRAITQNLEYSHSILAVYTGATSISLDYRYDEVVC